MNLATALVPPDAAQVIRAYGDEIRIHLGGAHTGGQYMMFTHTAPPGSGPPPHFHTGEDKGFFVLEGRASFLIEKRWREVPPGGSVFAPRHTLHTFKNAGDSPLKMLVTTTPAGFETFLKQWAAEGQTGGTPDMSRLLEIGAGNGIYFPTLEASAVAKQGTPSLPPAIVPPGEAQVCRLFGEEISIRLDAKQTGGKFTSFVEVTPPGGGPPPHTFAIEDQWFFVQAGRVSFFAEGRWSESPPGTAFFAPRKSVHTFKNVGDSPARMLVHTAPAGIEKCFVMAHDEFANPGGPDLARVTAVAAQHGLNFV